MAAATADRLPAAEDEARAQRQQRPSEEQQPDKETDEREDRVGDDECAAAPITAGGSLRSTLPPICAPSAIRASCLDPALH